MDLNKQNIETFLSNLSFQNSDEKLLDNNLLSNVQLFGSEIIIDLQIQNPTLQYKKKVEQLIVNSLKQNFDLGLSVKLNFSVKPSQQENKIKGSPIPGVKNIIAVSSGKGGVGKSTISANLSVALAQLDYKVGLIDADIYGPSIPIMFDMVGESPRAIEIDGKKKMQPIENYNVKMVSMGFFTQLNEAIVWRGPMASKALNQLIWDSYWGELDYLIVDLPPGTLEGNFTGNFLDSSECAKAAWTSKKNGLRNWHKITCYISENKIKGIKIAKQAKGKWIEDFDERLSPMGKRYFWLTGEFIKEDESNEADQNLLDDNYISVVPVRYDLTDYSQIDDVKRLLNE